MIVGSGKNSICDTCKNYTENNVFEINRKKIACKIDPSRDRKISFCKDEDKKVNEKLNNFKTFQVSELFWQHEIGNKNCKIGWCDIDTFPEKCKCGGLIHADWGEEFIDSDYFLYRKCDQCGENYEE